LDMILAFLLGSLVSRGITGSAALSETIVACAVLVALHSWITRAACRHRAVGSFFEGDARVVVEDGEPLPQAMRRSHISREDLEEALRLHGNVDDIRKVARAYKERSGQISVIRKEPR